MTSIKYVVKSSMISVEDIQLLSYGIACLQNDRATHFIEDISPNKNLVERKVALFNVQNLSPEHFIDAVDDFITEISM